MFTWDGYEELFEKEDGIDYITDYGIMFKKITIIQWMNRVFYI